MRKQKRIGSNVERKSSMKWVYIVICTCINGDGTYFIDSVWTSKRKAVKRCKELNQNSDKNLEDCGY